MTYEATVSWMHQTGRLADQEAVIFVKDRFEAELVRCLRLHRVPGPLVVPADSGLQDNLNGVEQPVAFGISAMDGQRFEVVHSLAKWKRLALSRLEIPPGEGICVDMKALRPQEDCLNSKVHSVYVDQWDWEQVLPSPAERTPEVLRGTVCRIFEAIKRVEESVAVRYAIDPVLPDRIAFIQAADLAREFPNLSPKEREVLICRRHGAVFLMGIGGVLCDGFPHDGRAPDYDDWSTVCSNGNTGLNGDILVWNEALGEAFELSSMGIRVDREALLRQLALHDAVDRAHLPWHRMLLAGALPPSIGGGIGQSRLCMLLLRKCHIGQVQASVWPQVVHERCLNEGFALL